MDKQISEHLSSDDIWNILLNKIYKEKNFLVNETTVIENYLVDSNLSIARGMVPPFFPIIFKNCIFSNEIKFSISAISEMVTFDNCIFENIAVFNTNKTLHFLNNCFFKNDLYISAYEMINLTIADGCFSSLINIKGNIKGSVLFENININKEYGGDGGYLEFDKVNVNRLWTKNIICAGIKIVNNSSLYNEASFEKIIVNDFILNGAAIGLTLRIIASQITNLNIDNISGNRKIDINNTKVLLSGLFAMHMMNRTSILSCDFLNELILWGENSKDSIFALEKTTIKRLKFDKVFNEGLITLREIKINTNGILAISSSNLGRTDFILCDFSKAALEFENSKITETFLAETDFPKIVKVNSIPNYAQAQLFFGQLNTAFKNQGDTVRALEYQSREIESHYKNINFFSKYFFTKLNLGLNKLSNDFGRNWIRGIGFTFTLGAIFFYFLVISSKEYHFAFTINVDSKLFASYLRFMNPLRFFDTENLFKINSDKSYLTLTGLSYLWDFLGRIFIGYGFYQTIQAFRKFGRK